MASNLQIIGIAGTNGSGKDSAGYTLADRHGYLFVSVTDLLRAELNKRGLPVTREHLRALSAEWRRQYGYGVLVDMAVNEFRRMQDQYIGVAIASLRNPAEADRVHDLGGMVLWVDADPRVRYERIQNNAEARARAGEDAKSFEEFVAEEEAEMHPSGDAATLDMAGVKKKSDIFLVNDNTDLAHFQDFITEQLFGKHDPAIVNLQVQSAEEARAEQIQSPPPQAPAAPTPAPAAPEPPQSPVSPQQLQSPTPTLPSQNPVPPHPPQPAP